MKVLANDTLTPNNPGSVTFFPEGTDDLWLIYRLIAAGDTITAVTYLCSHPESAKSEVIIKVISASYDNNSSVICVKGRTLAPVDYMKGISRACKAGVHYTVMIEINNEYNLTKKKWNEDGIKLISEVSDKTSDDIDLAVVLMYETRAVQILAVGQNITKLFSKILSHSTESEFFHIVFNVLVKHIDLDSIRCLAIGSLGELKSQFRQFLLSKSCKLKTKLIEKNKSKIVLVNKNKLEEVLVDKNVLHLMNETKSAAEITLYKKFTDMFDRGSDLVAYGLNSIENAHEFGAIETLLIAEDLIRSSEVLMTKKYAKLVENVKEAGGNTVVISKENISDEEELDKFMAMGGVAAILRWKLPDIDDIQL